MRAKFIGKDKSMGFRTGRWYNFTLVEQLGCIVLRETNGLFCPYSNMRKLLENWEF